MKRWPDDFLLIDEDGTIMGDREPFKKQYIYKYIPRLNDAMRLGEAMKNATRGNPQVLELTVRHLDKIGIFYCRLHKVNGYFLLKGWKKDERKIYYLPPPRPRTSG